MTIAEEASGTLTATGGTDQDLAAVSAVDGIFQLVIDLNDMILADKIEVKVWEMTIAAGTARALTLGVMNHAQVDKLWVSPAMTFMHNWKFTIKASAGSISIPWSIRKIT